MVGAERDLSPPARRSGGVLYSKLPQWGLGRTLTAFFKCILGVFTAQKMHLMILVNGIFQHNIFKLPPKLPKNLPLFFESSTK